MGLATIINMIVFVCVPAWGPWAATLAWTLWWIDVVLSLSTNLLLPFIIIHKHEACENSSADIALLTQALTVPALHNDSRVAPAYRRDYR